ncbi:hypothetical protein QE152_g38701 [Popillia japonica]|uniref:ATP synthase F0 subunit 8 n=1 Tax=Popillia japonica TaxID=7064 RepID=A0AAW1HWD5_POPJA
MGKLHYSFCLILLQTLLALDSQLFLYLFIFSLLFFNLFALENGNTYKKKRCSPIIKSKMMMMEFLKKNPLLISGKFNSNFSYKGTENSS